MTAQPDELAKVVADLQAGRVMNPPNLPSRSPVFRAVTSLATTAVGPLVDATMIYETYLRKPQIALYEDHPCIAPPWGQAFIGYRNEHGNANVTFTYAVPWEKMRPGDRWESEHGYDVDEAKWCLWLWMFSGGRNGTGRKVPTVGPIALTQIAVAEDGHPIDIHWVDIMRDGKPEQWDWSRWTVMGAYTLLNCRNVTIAEQHMPRAAVRRERRLGVRSHVLVVTGKGSRSQGEAVEIAGDDAPPLHSVRGHFAHYGACCRHHEPRGLLFGKYTGRVWVPDHARGSDETGTVDQTFVVQP